MSFQEYAANASRSVRSQRLKPVAIAGAVLLVCVCAIAIIFGFFSSSSDAFAIQKADESSSNEASQEDVGEAAQDASIYVHVAGSVNAPGLYELPQDARLAQAIEAAGGFSEDAATSSVNLARTVEDGEQILVSSAVVQEGGEVASAEGASAASPGTVNINTADESELQTISGIGPSKASKIIAYREANGSFISVDELCNVSGIGEKTLESIRDQISVG